MDNFMDKLAQKLNAQEIIRANAGADAAELEHLEKQTEVLQNQINGYNECLQEMRRLNLKNVESAQNIQELSKAAGDSMNQMAEISVQGMRRVIEESLAKIEAMQIQIETQSDLKGNLAGMNANLTGMNDNLTGIKNSLTGVKDGLTGMQENLTEVKDGLAELKVSLEEQFKKSEEYIHVENVKVYRNVQASMIEELGKQTETILRQQEGSNKGYKILLPFSIITMIVSFATLGMFVCRLLGLI